MYACVLNKEVCLRAAWKFFTCSYQALIGYEKSATNCFRVKYECKLLYTKKKQKQLFLTFISFYIYLIFDPYININIFFFCYWSLKNFSYFYIYIFIYLYNFSWHWSIESLSTDWIQWNDVVYLHTFIVCKRKSMSIVYVCT